MSDKLRIASELFYTLEDVSCGECPLDKFCDNVCLCEILKEIMENESEDK